MQSTKHFHFIAALIAAIVVAAATLASCANPGTGPDGGPYDETPPRIVSMSPALGDSCTRARKVTINFDELIKVENAQEKIIISPPQIEAPEIKTSGKRISVELLDSLKPNTTYTIDFSDAIVDSNEGNPLGNFTYFFSTGQTVDTMEVAGYVLDASNLEPIKGILVGLHSNLADSAFTALPFDRVARTDGYGHFSIKGVARGKYRIYALKDMDNDFRYSRGEMLAFNHQTIEPSCYADTRNDTLWADTTHIDSIRHIPFTHFTPDDVVLTAFTETNTSRQLLKTQREPNYFRTFFTARSSHVPEVKGLNFNEAHAYVEQRSAGNDTITYWLRDTALVNQDTLRCLYTYEATDDSTGINSLRTDTLEFIPRLTYAKRQKLADEERAKFEKQRDKRHRRGDFSQESMPATPLKVTFNVPTGMAPDRNVTFALEEPPARLDTAGFHLFLKVDSTYHEAPFRLERDSVAFLSWSLRAEWRPGQEYLVNVDSASVEGLSGKVNAAYDARLTIGKTDSFGSLFLLIPGADSTAIVQVLQSADHIERQVPVRNGRADIFYLKPGKYYVRLFNDHNGNGQWDTGCYAEDRQAEEVYYFPQSFTIRANWDIEQTWHINEVPLFQQKPRELVKQKGDTKKTIQNRNAQREREKRGN